MPIAMDRGTVGAMIEIVDAVASWQRDELPVQVHPGDIGWNSSFGIQALADDLRVWRRGGEVLAVAMVDDDSAMIRMAIAPSVADDRQFGARLVADISNPDRGVLPTGQAIVEARFGDAFRAILGEEGWTADEPWTPLSRNLIEPVEECGLRIEAIAAGTARDEIVRDRVAVQRASFANSTFTLERWRAMAASPAYRNARCLVAYDAEDHAVAATTVWSAGPGRPGLIEPLGAHAGYRGQGHGRAITLAAAAALRDMGASSVRVCTPSSNVGAVAAYVSAGFDRLPDVTDFRRATG